MPSWEQSTTNLLSLLRLQSLKSKIIAFALLATLIPSLSMGWVSYLQNKRFLSQKITQELHNATSHASRELDLWLKERLYELGVFSSSYVVSENLEKILRENLSYVEKRTALHRVKDYLKSVRNKFLAYEELLVVDGRGKVVASSYPRKTAVALPDDWLKLAQARKSIVGKPFWDNTLEAGVMLIAKPIINAHERFLGILVGKLNFRSARKILEICSLDRSGELYLITQKGKLLISSHSLSSGFMEIRLPPAIVTKLFSREANTFDYKNYRGSAVVGTLRRVPNLSWGVVAEEDREKAYAQIFRLRNLTIALVSGLFLLIGLGAYLLGLTIVRPLDRLINGAAKVAAGDLDVELPVPSHGELGYMTEVFNHMVIRLRQGRDELGTVNETLRQRNLELHELSVTDSLTSLYNRKHLMETLGKEIVRSKRRKHPFAVLMIDIDHFKKYNDTFGHLAGDEVLRKMAGLFKGSIRACDYTARYGGEEFLFILPETKSTEALNAAERIRIRVAKEAFVTKKKTSRITISIGIALFPDHGSTPEALIKGADAALYQAKEAGRNQVVLYPGRGKKKNKRS